MQKELFLGEQKIVYYEKGKGTPFLILHGWGGSTSPTSNLKFQELLAKKGFRVFVIALPGFGDSSLPTIKGGEDEITESVVKFADKLKLKRFFLYGHCFGGLIAIKIGQLHPHRVRGIVLCAVPSPFVVRATTKIGRPGLILYLLIAELSQLFLPPVSFFRKLRRWLHRQFKFYQRKRGTMWRSWQIMMNKDFKEVFVDVEKMTIPVLIVLGTKENPVIRSGTNFFKRIPNSTSKVIIGANHSIQIDAPEKLVREITLWFDKKIKREYN
ncbi:MAG: alpha/beta hydrolase [Candidatus Nealsonbacteria bacterium]